MSSYYPGIPVRDDRTNATPVKMIYGETGDLRQPLYARGIGTSLIKKLCPLADSSIG